MYLSIYLKVHVGLSVTLVSHVYKVQDTAIPVLFTWYDSDMFLVA